MLKVIERKSQTGLCSMDNVRTSMNQTFDKSPFLLWSRLLTDPGAATEIEALVTLLYMLVISHEDDQDFMDELG